MKRKEEISIDKLCAKIITATWMISEEEYMIGSSIGHKGSRQTQCNEQLAVFVNPPEKHLWVWLPKLRNADNKQRSVDLIYFFFFSII